MNAVPHPETEEIELTAVLDALSDPIRLSIVKEISGGQELSCGGFGHITSKTNLAYHLAKLREAGVSRTRTQGTSRYISLRKADLDRRFPGLLDAVLGAEPAATARKAKTAGKAASKPKTTAQRAGGGRSRLRSGA